MSKLSPWFKHHTPQIHPHPGLKIPVSGLRVLIILVSLDLLISAQHLQQNFRGHHPEVLVSLLEAIILGSSGLSG